MRTVRFLAALLVPAAVALGLLSDELVGLAYERGEFDAASRALTADALVGFAFALPALGLSLVGTRAWISKRRPWPPTAATFVGLLVNAGLDALLIGPLGVAGIGIATAVAHGSVGLSLMLTASEDSPTRGRAVRAADRAARAARRARHSGRRRRCGVAGIRTGRCRARDGARRRSYGDRPRRATVRRDRVPGSAEHPHASTPRRPACVDMTHRAQQLSMSVLGAAGLVVVAMLAPRAGRRPDRRVLRGSDPLAVDHARRRAAHSGARAVAAVARRKVVVRSAPRRRDVLHPPVPRRRGDRRAAPVRGARIPDSRDAASSDRGADGSCGGAGRDRGRVPRSGEPRRRHGHVRCRGRYPELAHSEAAGEEHARSWATYRRAAPYLVALGLVGCAVITASTGRIPLFSQDIDALRFSQGSGTRVRRAAAVRAPARGLPRDRRPRGRSAREAHLGALPARRPARARRLPSRAQPVHRRLLRPPHHPGGLGARDLARRRGRPRSGRPDPGRRTGTRAARLVLGARGQARGGRQTAVRRGAGAARAGVRVRDLSCAARLPRRPGRRRDRLVRDPWTGAGARRLRQVGRIHGRIARLQRHHAPARLLPQKREAA